MYFKRELNSYLLASIPHLQRNGQKEAITVLQEAEPSLTENTEVDNWNGGTYYHTLTLFIPMRLYERVAPHINEVESQILDTVNSISGNIGNESLELVRILPTNIVENEHLHSRQESSASENDDIQIWNGRKHRVFFSHLAEYKKEASDLKHIFESMRISCFVAHEDIEPTKEWQIVIERALKSCSCVVALMHKNFHESNWTDQEIGIAYGLGKPIIAVLEGTDPYGFIGKFQGIRDSASKFLWWEVLKRLPFVNNTGDAFILALSSARTVMDVRKIADMLQDVPNLNMEQTKQIFKLAEKNTSIRQCYVLWTGTSKLKGLCMLLKEWVGIIIKYDKTKGGAIIPRSPTNT